MDKKEEILRSGNGTWTKSNILNAMQEYSDLVNKQLLDRVAELEKTKSTRNGRLKTKL